jgi:hypothetical protein
MSTEGNETPLRGNPGSTPARPSTRGTTRGTQGGIARPESEAQQQTAPSTPAAEETPPAPRTDTEANDDQDQDDTSSVRSTTSEVTILEAEQLLQRGDIVALGEEHCRVLFKPHVQSGRHRRTVVAICGMHEDECNLSHQAIREADHREPPGGYARVVGNRFHGHALKEGVFIRPDHLAQAERNLRGRQTPPPPPPGRPRDQRRSDGTPARRTTLARPPPTRDDDQHEGIRGATPDPNQWLGMQSANGSRILVTTPGEALTWNRQGYSHVRTFPDKGSAQEWVAQLGPRKEQPPRSHRHQQARGGPGPDPESPDSSSEGEDSADDQSRRAGKQRDRERAKSDKSDGESDSSDVSSHRKAPHRRAARRPLTRDSSSEDSGSSSSRSRTRRSRRKSRQKRKGTRRHRSRTPDSSTSGSDRDRQRRNRLPKGKTLLIRDTSTGSDEMFGLELGSSKLLASLGPPGMSRRMGKELFDYPTDLLALPGTSSSSGQENAEYETQQTIGQLSEFLQAPKSHHRVHDTVWRNRNRHALGKVQTPEGLAMLADDYLNTQNRAQSYETQRLKDWMRRHHYSDRDTERYQQTGGLPIVMRAIGNLYLELLIALRTVILKHSTAWTGSYAQAMLEYHKKELGHIRGMAGQRKDFLLTTYTYLRDASRSKWTNQEIQAAMCVELNAAMLAPPPTMPRGEAGDRRKGCRCQNQALHTILQLDYFDAPASLCPVASTTNNQKARSAAKILKTKIDDHVRQHGGAPPKTTWQPWAAKAVAAATAGQSSI